MTQPKATTMGLPVKLVRKVARLTFNFQLEALKVSVVKVAKEENERIAADNRSVLVRLGLFKAKPLHDLETIYETWKELYLSRKMRADHPAIDTFWRDRLSWWKRLRQFCELPEADDDRIIHMSMEDLALIDYDHFLPEALEKLAAEAKERVFYSRVFFNDSVTHWVMSNTKWFGAAIQLKKDKA